MFDDAGLREAVDAAGYTGEIEVEILNADIWDADPTEELNTMQPRCLSCLRPEPAPSSGDL